MKKWILTLIFLSTTVSAQTIESLPQFVSTTSPSAAITQRTFGKAIKITGLTTGLCLSLDSNNLITTTTCGSGGGGGADGNWVFFNGSGIRLATTTNQVIIGATATSSLSNPLAKLHVTGDVLFSGAGTTTGILTSYVEGRAPFFTATSTTRASTLPLASTTQLTVSSLFNIGGDAFDELVGTGLQLSSGDLQTTLGTSVDLASAEITGTLAVGNGGSGATTLTGILLGNGSSPFTAITTSAGVFGAISDETGGSGVLVGNSSPVFTSRIETPQVIGGTGATSNLVLRSSGGVGTSDYINFETGNNGAVVAGRINTYGYWGIGTTTPQWNLQVASSTQSALTVSDGSSTHVSFRAIGGGLAVATSSPTTYATSSVNLVSFDSNGQPTLPYLKSCDTIDTSSTGVLSCGTDASGGGGAFGQAWEIAPVRYLAPTTTVSVIVGATTSPSHSLFQANATGTTGNLITASSTPSFAGNYFNAFNSSGTSLLSINSSGALQLDTSSTGVTLDTDGDGMLIIAATSNGSNEDLRLNLDDTANTISLTSTTGVTNIDYGTIAIAGALGAVGTPGHSFTGDLNTGLWSPGADSLSLAVGGAEVMRSNLGLYTGFGTTTPRWLLQLASSTAPQLTLSDASNSSLHWSLRNAGGNLYFATSSPSTFATGTPAAVEFRGTGTAVGIATSSPWRVLSVVGTVALDGLTQATAGSNDVLCISETTDDVIQESTGSCVVSSRRFKHDIEKLNVSGLDIVASLKPSTFKRNGEEMIRWGFIAEEVAESATHLASYEQDNINTNQPRGLDDHAFLAVLTDAIQEMWGKVKSLIVLAKDQENRIETLEKQNADLMFRLEQLESKNVGN